MFNEWLNRLRRPTRRALALGLAGLIAFLALGGGLWLSLQPRHVALPAVATQSGVTQSNQGYSLLYISTSVAAGLSGHYEDTLTMFRTSDGKELWHYHASGSISNGFEQPDGAIRAGTAVEVVNGVVYFLVDSAQPTTAATSQHQLMALRASNGQVLWQRTLQTGIAQILSISDGIICLESSPNAHSYSDDTLMLAGYRADSGALAWQRQWNTITGKLSASYFLSSLDGLLYFLASPPVVPAPDGRIVAVSSFNGQTLWSSDVQQVDPLNTFPLLSEQGLVVFLIGSGSIISPTGNFSESLVGFDTNSGAVRWRYQLSGFSLNHAFGAQEDNGILYVPTLTEQPCCPITITSFSVTALRIADGRQLWRNTLAHSGVVLLATRLAQGLFYANYQTFTGGGRAITITGTVVAALQTSDGALRWADHSPDQQGYTSLTTTQDGTPALAQGDTIFALQPQDGSTRWQQTITTGQHGIFLRSAGGKLVASFQDTNADGGAGPDHLCALEPASGKTLWCHTFDTQLSWVESGP